MNSASDHRNTPSSAPWAPSNVSIVGFVAQAVGIDLVELRHGEDRRRPLDPGPHLVVCDRPAAVRDPTAGLEVDPIERRDPSEPQVGAPTESSAPSAASGFRVWHPEVLDVEHVALRREITLEPARLDNQHVQVRTVELAGRW